MNSIIGKNIILSVVATVLFQVANAQQVGDNEQAQRVKSALVALQNFAAIYGRNEESKRAVNEAYERIINGNGKYIATRIDYYQEAGTGYWRSTSSKVGEGATKDEAIENAIFNDQIMSRPNKNYKFRSSAILVGQKSEEGTEVYSVSSDEIKSRIKQKEKVDRDALDARAAEEQQRLKLELERKNREADEAVAQAAARKKQEDHERAELARRDADEAKAKLKDYYDKKEKAARCYNSVSEACIKAGAEFNEVFTPNAARCAAPRMNRRGAGGVGLSAVGGRKSCDDPGGCIVCAAQLREDVLYGEIIYKKSDFYNDVKKGYLKIDDALNTGIPSGLKGSLKSSGGLLMK